MKKSSAVLIFILSTCVFLTGCPKTMIIPDDKYNANYEKMFDAAISAGLNDGFTPQYQDKNKGQLVLIQERQGFKEPYKIIVQFGKLEGGMGYKIQGEPNMADFISMYVRHVERAIKKASGME